MSLYADIAASHLRSRRRQTLVSLSGVVLGVAFFLAVSALMRGSERDFIARLVDTAPHVTISDEFRNTRQQPATVAYPGGAVSVKHVKPLAERRGIRQYKQKLAFIDAQPGVTAAPVLVGQAIFSFAGRDESVTLSGIVAARMKGVSSITEDIIAGSIDEIDRDHNGIIIGEGLAKNEPVAGRHGLGGRIPGQRAPHAHRRAVSHGQRALRRGPDVRADQARAGAHEPAERRQQHHPAARRCVPRP
jgi:lipoprotein-releasing system permease protein